MKLETKMKYESGGATLKWITDLFDADQIVTIRNIQRPQQKKNWTDDELDKKTKQKKDKFSRKSNEFLELTFNGGSELSPFNLVDFKVLKEKIESEIELIDGDEISSGDISEENQIKKEILKKLLHNLQKKESKGDPLYVLMDGQNRLEFALGPFFKKGRKFIGSDLKTSNREAKGVTFVSDDDISDTKYDFTFDELTLEEQEVLENIPIIINLGKYGNVTDFTDTIVRLNDGVPWTPFEKYAIKWTPIVDRLNDTFLIDRDTKNYAIIHFFRILHGMKNTYDLAKRGDQKFIMEMVYWMSYRSHPSNTDLDLFTDMNVDKDDKKLRNYEDLERYLMVVANAHGLGSAKYGEKVLNKYYNMQTMKSLIILMFMLEQKSKSASIKNCLIRRQVFKMDDENMGKYIFKTPKGDTTTSLLKPIEFIERFAIWHTKKISNLLNPNDFQENLQGKGGFNDAKNRVGREPKEGTYADSMYTPSKINQREACLFEFIETQIPQLIKDKVIRLIPNRKATDLFEVLERMSYKDVYESEGNGLKPLNKLSVFDADLHIDHQISISKGGSDSLNNKVVTKKSTNLKKGSRV